MKIKFTRGTIFACAHRNEGDTLDVTPEQARELIALDAAKEWEEPVAEPAPEPADQEREPAKAKK